MTIDDLVLGFIKCTRISNNDSNQIENEENRIKKLFNKCLSSVVSNYDGDFVPSLIICDTYNKYSAVLPVKLKRNKYKYYVLYDIYLSKINRIFNSIYFDNNDSGHDVWKLSYELFAEDALLENDEALYTYFGLNKVALGPFKLIENQQENLDFITSIQEYYIIGHELGHWIFKVLNDSGNTGLFNISFTDSWIDLLKDIKDILCELYAEYEKQFQDKDYIELIQEQKSIILENIGILEECFSDAIAYAIVFSYIETEYNGDINKKTQAGQALFLELMNLQLLAMQHMTVSEESFESSVSIRFGFFRNYIGLYFENNEKQIKKIIEDTAIRYENRITNLMLECFNELEKRSENLYDGLIDVDGLLDMSKMLGVDDIYRNADIT